MKIFYDFCNLGIVENNDFSEIYNTMQVLAFNAKPSKINKEVVKREISFIRGGTSYVFGVLDLYLDKNYETVFYKRNKEGKLEKISSK